MTVLVVPPECPPVIADIPGTLSSLQEAVGGYIEAIYPFDDCVALICNEEGKLSGLPLNRALYNSKGEIVDIIAGTFLCAYAPDDCGEFCSLPQSLCEKYAALFKDPQLFLSYNGTILAVPCGRG